MGAIFHVSISTPEKTVFNGDIQSLIAPGELGYLAILANHAPLITTLVAGRISITDGAGKTTVINSSGNGFMEVSNNNAVLVLDAPSGAISSRHSA